MYIRSWQGHIVCTYDPGRGLSYAHTIQGGAEGSALGEYYHTSSLNFTAKDLVKI